MSLSDLLATATYERAALTAHVEPQWLQGRTVYGGLSAALAYAAAARLVDDLPPLRSAQAAFVGPLADTLRAEPVLLRRGKNSAFIGCDVSGGAGIGLRALFLFAASRESTLDWRGLPPPTQDAPTVPVALPPGVPKFMSNFEVARVSERVPNGFRRWVRLKEREALDPVFELLAIADALPPAAMALAKEVGPISTTTWQVNVLTDAPATEEGWWLIETVTLDVGSGTSSQAMTIWNRRGQAIATATQSVALFF